MDELTIPSCLSFDSQYYSDRWRRVAYGREESKPLRHHFHFHPSVERKVVSKILVVVCM